MLNAVFKSQVTKIGKLLSNIVTIKQKCPSSQAASANPSLQKDVGS